MFNTIIRFSLNNRLAVIAAAVFLAAAGFVCMRKMPVDVLPDLNRPRVVVMAESPGMAPEEVETLVTLPLETYLNGAAGVVALRSSSTVGLSMLTIEFGWGNDPLRCRQIVEERLQMAAELLPPGVTAQMAPMASMMGQIMYLTLWDETGDISPMELRTLADWTVRPRILSIAGVSEVLVIGGDRKEYQVLADLKAMYQFGITFDAIKEALEGSSRNVTGGFLTGTGPNELLVRTIGRIDDYRQLNDLVVGPENDPPVRLSLVARIAAQPAVKVGTSGVYRKNEDGSVISRPSVVLVIEKQTDTDTRRLSKQIRAVSGEIERALHGTAPGIKIEPLYEQETFINLAVANVVEALWVGAVLIVLVLFIFLMNLRITLITIVAIPVSLLTACLIFARMGLSINTMTLGGLAVAIGELVDDAIVDVENIYRRLRENFKKPRQEREKTLSVVFHASAEIRNSIVYGTMIVVIVFLPVFFLSGMEGKLFAPMGVSYIVSLLASLLVSLTVTPVLAYWILPQKAKKNKIRESVILRVCQFLAELAIRFSLAFPRTVLTLASVATAVFGFLFFTLKRDFMPPFNEGAPQVNVILPVGTSLETSDRFGAKIAEELLSIQGVDSVVRKTGRPERDEHAVPVNISEMMCTLNPESGRSISEIFADIDSVIAPEKIPGATAFYDQPIQHLMAHLRTGTTSKIALKIRGDDPSRLRRRAWEIQRLLSAIPGIGTMRLSPIQQDIPQIKFILDREALARYGLIPEEINRQLETVMRGEVTTQILEGKQSYDVLLRADDSFRKDLDVLKRLPFRTDSGVLVPLSKIAKIDPQAVGPSRIDHEGGRPQIAVEISPPVRSPVEIKEEIDRILLPQWDELCRDGISIELTGLFESEQESSRTLMICFIGSLIGIVLVLYKMFGSMNLAMQVLSALPVGLAGGVAAILLTGQDRSIPNLVGMISLCGIASRNGILILDHYLHLVRYEGESWTKSMILRAGKDRVAPVMMTTLTAILGLWPITLSPETPGREILYPIATVIVGGLITSTMTEFFVRPALFWLFGRGAAQKRLEQELAGADILGIEREN